MCMQESTVEVRGYEVRVLQAGDGGTILYLHGFTGSACSPLLHRLSRRHRVIAPEHPGFGRSQIPEWLMGIGDLALFYLDLVESLDLAHVHLVGHGIGGWIAAELAIRNAARLASLTLLAPAGIVVPGVSIADIFLIPTEELLRRQLHDPAAPAAAEWLRENTAREIDIVLQNRAALARIGWSPRLHNPQLPYWLHRIDVPTLLVWGEQDRIIPFACRQPYLEEMPRIELLALPNTGHALEAEQSTEIAARLDSFIAGARR
jgi:pimeloyl-ACP methyl ester carboxylesterase